MELIVLKLSVTNCFLVKIRNKYILIDTALNMTGIYS